MKILILSCNTGGGHNSVANALLDCLCKNGFVCKKLDALLMLSEKKSEIISYGHSFVYKHFPKSFGVTYNFFENHTPKENRNSIIFKIMSNACSNLFKEITENNYDAVICTHIFAMHTLTQLKKSGLLKIPFFLFATDYTCSPGVSEGKFDAVFIPHAELESEFINKGIKKEKLIPCCMPISEDFFKNENADYAKKCLSLEKNKDVLLIMSGSIGCGNIFKLTKLLSYGLNDNIQIAVICGNNTRLLTRLQNANFKNVKAIGYTDKIPLYMDAAKLMITKPGGISVSEAAAKGLPMIFFNAVPGCESRNSDFFVSRQLVTASSDINEISDIAIQLLNDENKLYMMRCNLKSAFLYSSPEIIEKTVTESIMQRI